MEDTIIKTGPDAGKTERQLHDEVFGQSPLDYFMSRMKFHGIEQKRAK